MAQLRPLDKKKPLLKPEDIHLLFIIGIITKGGAEITMMTVARGLRARGYRVTLVTYGCNRDFVGHAGPDVEVIKINEERTFAVFVPLYRILRDLRPDVLISTLTHTNVLSIMTAAAARADIRVVVTEHGQVALDPRFLKKSEKFLLPKLAGFLYASTDEVIAVSKGLAKFLEGILAWPRKRAINVIYNPVIRELPAASPHVPHAWLGQGYDPVVISVGRMEEVKNFSLLIRAFAVASSKRAARLIILGEGTQRDELLKLVNDLGLQDRVLFPGFVPNVQEWVQRAAVFVCTSLLEAFGNAIVEAMACGVTVVSVDCPTGPAEILENERYGYLVPPDNIEALASAIVGAIDNPMDKNFIRSRAASFNETQCFDAYEKIVRELCA